MALLSALLLVGSLVAVVVAHTMVAEDQVRLSGVQAQLATASAAQQQLELSVAQLEDPQRISHDAEVVLHMALAQPQQLPPVSLATPLPAPHLTPDPAAATPTTGSTATSG